MFKKLLYSIVIILIIFIIVGLFLPRQIHIERSARIDAAGHDRGVRRRDPAVDVAVRRRVRTPAVGRHHRPPRPGRRGADGAQLNRARHILGVEGVGPLLRATCYMRRADVRNVRRADVRNVRRADVRRADGRDVCTSHRAM